MSEPAPPSPDEVVALLAATPTQAFLAGRWIDTGATFPVVDPATGADIAAVADAGPELFVAALDAADEAQPRVAAIAPRERAEILRRTHELMLRDRERLATLITLEMGKPLAESRGEVTYAAEFFRWFAEETCRVEGDYRTNPAGTGRILVTHRPVGPCLLITPWNFPIAMGARKIAPAFAAGCTSILKPATATPLTMLALAGLLEEAGLPAGALSVLPATDSSGTTGPLFQDPRLRKVSFTGSTEVGRALMRQSSEQILRISLELGGSAPFLVFEDADLDTAVDGAMAAKLRNGGEACTAANRFLVHESVADEFASRLTERIAAQVVGPGLDPASQVGPMIDAGAQQRLAETVAAAAEAGARVTTGGRALDRPGFFFEPTVVTGLPEDCAIDRDELFGPVAPIRTFTTEDEAIAMANDSPYGLVSFVFTEQLARGLRVSEALESGMVGLNRGVVSDPAAPFGGVKQSGLGREGGRQGIHEYLEPRYLALP